MVEVVMTVPSGSYIPSFGEVLVAFLTYAQKEKREPDEALTREFLEIVGLN